MAQAEFVSSEVWEAARRVLGRASPPMDEPFSRANAIAIYGSRARGDADPTSDVDVLVITDHSSSRAVTEGHVSVTFYPRDMLLKLARRGDLFVLHLVAEAKFPYDPRGFHSELARAFRYRPSYRREVLNAAALGWFLVRRGPELDPHLVNRRVAWCVRTILIAEAAQRRRPVFSTEQLARVADDPSVLEMVRSKSQAGVDFQNLARLAAFLRRRGLRETRRSAPWTIEMYSSYFRRTGNGVGVRTSVAGDANYTG